MSYSECGAPTLRPGWHTGGTIPVPLQCVWGTGFGPLQGVYGNDSRPLQCEWGANHGPGGMSGAPAMGPCRMCGAPTLGLYSVSGGPIGAPTGWIRDAGFGSLGVKGPLACQSHGPSGPRDL